MSNVTDRICTVEGCKNKIHALKLCATHWVRLKKHGDVNTLLIGRHNMSDSSEYETWCGMKKRCLNQKSKYYSHYGGRGIKICERWVNSFSAFYKDMGAKPGPEYSIERLDNNANYSCGECGECTINNWTTNCKWATRQEQSINKRPRANNSGYTGVYWSKFHQKWRASTRHKKQNYDLGYYSTPEEAYEAYKLARASLLANDCLPQSLKRPHLPNAKFNPRIHSS